MLAGLKIAMDHAVLVGCFERAGDLSGYAERIAQTDRVSGQAIVERQPLHELQNQGWPASRCFEAVNGRDIRVVERGEDAGLAVEPRQPAGIGAEPLRE